MSETKAAVLVQLAAEGVAAVIGGCSKVLSSGLKPASPPSLGVTPIKGINYFGPHIINRWIAGLGTSSPADQIESLVQLSGMPVAESRQEAAQAVDRLAPDASSEDKTLAVEYLSAIPLAIRRALVPDKDTAQLTLPPTLPGDQERSWVRLLPPDVPPFPIGSELAGTSYQLEELLGIGGFGAVYKAKNRFEQNQPPRAIKFCLDASMVPTLQRERDILDRLMSVPGTEWSDHIVRLYGYALEAHPPFLVYEYVPGGDLTSQLTATRQQTGRGFKPAMALGLIRQVAEALAFAHEQGMVHRDLKPANVLMSGSSVKLTDFGVGGVTSSHAVRATQGGSFFGQISAHEQISLFRGSGTPLYMSPEQRRGDHPDPRHDLYSLGVVWYQLLVGDVTRELHPGWPDELVEEFQVPPEQIEIIQRCVGYFKKRPAHGRELLGLLKPSAMSAGATASAIARRRSSKTEKRPGEDPQAAEFERLKLLLADQIDKEAFTEARETVAAILKIRPEDQESLDAQAFLEETLGATSEESKVEGVADEEVGNQPLIFQDHQGWVRSVAFLPDGGRALSASDDTTIRIWDLETGQVIRTLTGHAASVMCIAVTADGKQALSGSWDGTIRLWDLDSGKPIRGFKGNWKNVKSVAISADGRFAMSGSDDNIIHLWDLEAGGEINSLTGHTDLVQSLAFSPDGRRALSGGDDNSVRLWDLEEGKEIRRLEGHTDTVTSVAFAATGRWIMSGSSDKTARIWDPESGRELRKFAGHEAWVNSVAYFPDGRRILTGCGGEIADGQFTHGTDTCLHLWDVASSQEITRLEGHTASVTSVAISPDGRRALSGSLDKTVRLWNLP
jgi:WD40 repeat protein/serine/threonine protein kinase